VQILRISSFSSPFRKPKQKKIESEGQNARK